MLALIQIFFFEIFSGIHIFLFIRLPYLVILPWTTLLRKEKLRYGIGKKED